jgi:peroxiredoxin (alkyl hydroperoxide reductase subunit C)
MVTSVRSPAPNFRARAVVRGEFQEISFSAFRGHYVVLLFYPLDFTFVCPTEIIAFSDRVGEFSRRDAHVLAISVDSHFTHLAWIRTPRHKGGLGMIDIPLVSDLTRSISRDYGVLLEDEGVALRGLFIIDRAGVVRHVLLNDLSIGRSVDDCLRTLDALQFVEEHSEVCPADWKPGLPGIRPEPGDARSSVAAGPATG